MQEFINFLGCGLLGILGVVIPITAGLLALVSFDHDADFAEFGFTIVGGWLCGVAFCGFIAALKALYG